MKINRYSSLRCFAASLCVLASAALPLHFASADTKTWTGNTSTNYNLGSNWDPSGAPGSSDTAVFTGAVTPNQPITSGGGPDINKMIFSTPTGGWTVGGTGQITFDGGGIDASFQTSGTNTISAPVRWNNSNIVNVGTGGTFVLSGVVSAAGSGDNWFKTGGGTLVLNASNDFDSEFRFDGGDLVIGANNATGVGFFNYNNGANVTVVGNRTLSNNKTEIGGAMNYSGGNLTITGNFQIPGSQRDITVNNHTTITGPIIQTAANGGLNVQGTGSLTIGGSASYEGLTTVTSGTLLVNGSISSASAVTVQAGGKLGGSGSVEGTVDVHGTLTPGNSPGALSLGATTLEPGSNYNWQILNAAGSAGVGFDTINLTTGSVLTIASTSGDTTKINLWSLSSIGPDVDGNAANFNSASNYSWTLFATDQAIVGFDADKFTINTSANNGTAGFSNAFTGTFSVGLADGGTDLVLVYTAVPEPSMGALSLAGVGLLVWMRRLRRSRPRRSFQSESGGSSSRQRLGRHEIACRETGDYPGDWRSSRHKAWAAMSREMPLFRPARWMPMDFSTKSKTNFSAL